MADDHPIEPANPGQLLHKDLKHHVHNRLRRAVDDLMSRADELRGLATVLDRYGELNTEADFEQLREAAVGVRAVANQAFLTAASTTGISERLSAWADVAGVAVPLDEESDEGPEEGEEEAPG